MRQTERTMQVTTTTLPPAAVLAEARRFFTRRNGIYTAFLEKEGPTFAAFRGQGGEEIIIGVRAADNATEVTGSTYLFDQQVARFLSTLAPGPSTVGAENAQ
jgi:hypothetical protein